MKKLILLICLAMAMPLMARTKVLALSGSTRKQSYNKKLMQEAVLTGRDMGLSFTVVSLEDYPMPFYSSDFESANGMPESAKRFQKLMIEHDAILIVCPEYNHSIPAILKNVLDWVSRSENGKSSREAFKGKCFALMSASPGKKGGARGLIHLRDIIQDIGGEVTSNQVCVGEAYAAFDEKGQLKNEALREQIREELEQIVLVSNRN